MAMEFLIVNASGIWTIYEPVVIKPARRVLLQKSNDNQYNLVRSMKKTFESINLIASGKYDWFLGPE